MTEAQQITRMRYEGHSNKRIARTLGFHRQTIDRRVRALGLPTRVEVMRAKVRRQTERGRRPKQIAESLGVSLESVRHFMRLEGVSKCQKMTRAQRLAEQGMTQRDAAKLCGVSESGLNHRMMRARKNIKEHTGECKGHELGS